MISLDASNIPSGTALIDATWLLPGGTADLDDYLPKTTHRIDTDRIKQLNPSERAVGSTLMFGDSGLKGQETMAVYDRCGLFSAPWIWWLLRSHGCDVRLVESWATTTDTSPDATPTSFESAADPSKYNATKVEVLAALGSTIQILDARSPGRFQGTDPEPRTECRSGHIPGSVNVPLGTLKSGRYFLDKNALMSIFEARSIDLTQPIITTCGSGVTASGLAFALTRCGAEHVKVYQGSWAEWGTDPDCPLEVGP